MIDNRNDPSQHADRLDGGIEGVDAVLRDLASFPWQSRRGAGTRPGRRDEDLLVCGGCRSRLMYPADCEERGPDRWCIELKCPDCGRRASARFDIEMLDALDRELDQAEAEIEADLAWLTRVNMTDYVARFVSALDAGAIEPEDFTA